MSSIKVEEGKLIIYLEDMIRDETMLRAIAKHAIFNELVLTALASLIVGGEVDWQDGDSPWWIGGSDFGPNFETARVKLAKLAPDGAQKLIEELRRQRDIIKAQSDIYQNRAWTAERLVRWNVEVLKERCRSDERDMTELAEICRRPAHAELDTSKFTGKETP
jgi:hypothetical protein